MKKVLLTGSSGFTGKLLTAHLIELGYKVYKVVRSKRSEDEIEINFKSISEWVSLFDEIQPDVVFHLAAISFARHKPVEEYYYTNTVLTDNILSAIKMSHINVSKVIISSTSHVYDFSKSGQLTEDSLLKPTSHYGASKLAMENIVSTYENDINLIITRPFNYIGNGQNAKFILPKIVSHFRERKSVIELGNTDVYRDFTDVRDVVAAYIALMNCHSSSGVFNICSGQPVSIQHIISMMEEIARYSIKIEVNKLFVREGEPKEIFGDNQKLYSATGFKPKISLFDSLASMYENSHGL